MTKGAYPLALAAVLACAMYTVPAQAQRARVFVASYGTDNASCGAFLSPCRNFQQAVNNVAAGGEVSAIDSAGFGTISITKAVTITSPDGVEAGIVSQGSDAIHINVGQNDAVVLRSLTLNGSNVAFAGIDFASGGSLTVINCVVQNFEEGIYIEPASGTATIVIKNTVASNNTSDRGIAIAPSVSATVNAVVDHVLATGNTYGITIGGSNTGPSAVAISDSIFSNNVSTGIGGFGTNVQVLLGRSVITNNAIGVLNSAATFHTYGNNEINLNGTDIFGSPLDTAYVLR
jgi:hypothetical protein